MDGVVDAEIINTDFLVVGSGLAGLNAALESAKHGSVTVVTKSDRTVSSSYWAQGGVAAVLRSPDTFQSHIEDTLQAGRYYGNPMAVEQLVREGAAKMRDLIEWGVPFDRSGDDFDLGLEGGHSNRRILHASGAATGKALVDFFHERVVNHPQIRFIEYAFAYNLLVNHDSGECVGVDAYLHKEKRSVRIYGRGTILASGGYSGLFSRTTNPHTSTGDGLWLAYQAGASLKDLEFIQFHPTAYYSEAGRTFLISEALRGEGARLYNRAGERFMLKYAERELAPRDIVSKEIHRQIDQQEEDYVYLDLQHLDRNRVTEKFPGLVARIEQEGIDIRKEGIPVSPAAHYCIGGVETDLNGQTSVDRLFAVGELGATGVHGANRLASNSLLECLVFSDRAAAQAMALPPVPKANCTLFEQLNMDGEKEKRFNKIRGNIAELLNAKVGIERNGEDLKEALKLIDDYSELPDLCEENEYYSIRLVGLLSIAKQITNAALCRKKSIGVHTRRDLNNGTDSPATPITYNRFQTA